MSPFPQQIMSFKGDKVGDQKSHKHPEEWDKYMTPANPRSRGSVKKLACFTAWMLCNSPMLPADDCICPSKLTSGTSLAETLHLACIFILGISELIFLVQQRDLKEAVSEKFQIPEQIFESAWSEWEREKIKYGRAWESLPSICSTLFPLHWKTVCFFLILTF